VAWIDTELVLVALAAMVSPTTLTFSVLALVLGDRPLRTGFLFFLGAFTVTILIGVVAAFVLGNTASSHTASSPKTWVSIFDIVAAVLLLAWVARLIHRPSNPQKIDAAVAQMSKIASSPMIAVVGAGAMLANPGGFIPIALKTISQTNPSTTGYIFEWLFFTIMALLPLAIALVLLLVARDWTERMLNRVRNWLLLHVRTIAAVVIVLLAVALLRNGIAGLTA
jgi:glucan phosphoethanolaminetransferase (alkaline phosphatase superfamily)